MEAVLFLHGRGPKPDADTLRAQWLSSLPALAEATQGEGLPVGMIYWADLEDETPPSPGDLEWVRGHLVGRAFAEIDGKPGLGHDDAGGTDIDRGDAESVVRDLAQYFRHDSSFRDGVRARVREAIQHVAEHVERILLLSNDLGTVIAYEVLTHRRYGQGAGEFVDIGDETRSKIDFVTMGSPLGWVYDAELAQYVRKSSKTFPRGMRRWINVYDEKDPLAAPPFVGDPTLFDEYTTFEHSPADNVVENPTRMPNSVYGYLQTEPVAAMVQSFVEQPNLSGKAR